jgi:hypothetical protein
MSRDTTVIRFRQPDAIDDPLSELAREGARRMLAQVLIAEADAFVAMWKDLKLPDGRDRVVRHGHGPRRAIQTGVGPVEVRRAKPPARGSLPSEVKSRATGKAAMKGPKECAGSSARPLLARGRQRNGSCADLGQVWHEPPCGFPTTTDEAIRSTLASHNARAERLMKRKTRREYRLEERGVLRASGAEPEHFWARRAATVHFFVGTRVTVGGSIASNARAGLAAV